MFKLKNIYMQEAGGEGGGGQGPAITPEIQAIIDQQVSAAVDGLKNKNAELLGKVKSQGDALKAFDGIDPNAVRSILQRFSDDEEAKLIASGKIDEVLNKRTERMKSAFEKDTQAAVKAKEAAEQRAAKFTRRVLENSIRSEAISAGIHQHAVDDAIFRASVTFLLDEEGNPAAVEGAFGKDGKPLTLKEWFADMKEKAPHWWPASQGGGGAGHGGANGTNTMTQADFDALPPKERAKRMASGVTIKG